MIKILISSLLIAFGIITFIIFLKKHSRLGFLRKGYEKHQNKTKGKVKINAIQGVIPSWWLSVSCLFFGGAIFLIAIL